MISPVTNSNNHYQNPVSNNNQATGSAAIQAPPQDESATVTISLEARQLSEGALDGLSSNSMARELPQELWGTMSQGSRNRWLESQAEFQQTFNQVSTEHSARLLAEQFRTQLFLNLTYNPEVRAFHEAGNIVLHGQLAEDFERFTQQLDEESDMNVSDLPQGETLPNTMQGGMLGEIWNVMSQEGRDIWSNFQERMSQEFNQVSTEHSARLLVEQFRLQMFLNLTYNPDSREFYEAGNIVFHGQLAEDFERFNQLLSEAAAEANPTLPPVEIPEYSNVSDIPAFDNTNLANPNNAMMLELFNSLNNVNTQNNTEENNPIMRIFGAHNLA